jgi:hypothetical protein
MLAEFQDEVLCFGPGAVLPQNFSNKWLRRMQKISDDFLDSNFRLDECRVPEDIGDPVLSACVYAILKYEHGDDIDVSPKEMAEKIAVYALSVMMESANRESEIKFDAPNLDNILSVERIMAYKDINPLFVNALKQACIIRESAKGWFENIKEKILSSVGGS